MKDKTVIEYDHSVESYNLSGSTPHDRQAKCSTFYVCIWNIILQKVILI